MDDPDTAYLRKVCRDFLAALPDPKLQDTMLPQVLSEEAARAGRNIDDFVCGLYEVH